jgi:hypothetical protein
VGSPLVQSNSSSKTREEDSLHISVRLALRNGWLYLATATVELAAAAWLPNEKARLLYAPAPSSCPYSPECVEYEFSEVRTELGVRGIMIGVDRVREPVFREAEGRRSLWTLLF